MYQFKPSRTEPAKIVARRCRAREHAGGREETTSRSSQPRVRGRRPPPHATIPTSFTRNPNAKTNPYPPLPPPPSPPPSSLASFPAPCCHMAHTSSPHPVDYPDVEDFVWTEEEKRALPPEKTAKVLDLMRSGNRAFRDKRLDEAISFYSKAQLLKPGDDIILCNRSAAFCRISQHLKERPAVDSEYECLNGLDPTTYAELALKDAERVMATQNNSSKSYFLKAKALVLLEHYEEARETIIAGLQVDPLSQLLRTYLQEVERITADSIAGVKHYQPQHTDDFECTLCLKLLYEPVTSPCGHSFCRSCLHQSMDHKNKCPMCRTLLFITARTYPISVTLNNIIQKNFPEEYAERKTENKNLTHLGVDILPLFVMDVVLPCQKLSLNIFEPRYRLMVRRVMEGSHHMGMVIIDPATGSIADFACEVEILECEPLPDGRFYLEVEGRRRFRILRTWDQDGYRVAEIEWIQDIHPPEGSKESADLQKMANGAAELVKTWIMHGEAARIGRRSRRLEALGVQGMPRPEDPERFSFWLINMLNLRPSERLDLLRGYRRDLHFSELKDRGAASNKNACYFLFVYISQAYFFSLSYTTQVF